LAPALLLFTASCGQNDRANQTEGRQGVGGSQSGTGTAGAPVPTLTIAATGQDNCAASWEGQAVTPAQITERSIVLLERVIAEAGGPENMTERTLPVPNVEAPADLSFACADTVLFALQRSGMASIRLRPAGDRAPVLMDFPMDANAPPPPVPAVLGIGAGGRMTWNNDPIDAAGLAAQLGRLGGSPAEPGELAPPPGGLELRITREATFGQVYELLRTTRRYDFRPLVFLPSAQAGPGTPPAGGLPAR
jgi:hypothetical protein